MKFENFEIKKKKSADNDFFCLRQLIHLQTSM